MRTIQFGFLVGLVLFSSSVLAQRNADETMSFKQDIESIQLDPLTGQIIVKEKDQISCYNPEEKKVIWTVTKEDLGKVAFAANAQKTLNALEGTDLLKLFESNEAIELIPESPFVRVMLEDKDAIINSYDGKVVFNSAAVGYRILSCQFLLEENTFLLTTTDGKMFNCAWYDLAEGKEKWITPLSSVEGLGAQLKSMLSLKNTASEDKTEVATDAVYTSINGILYKLDKNTGDIKWKTDYKINRFYLAQSEKDVIIIKNSGSILSSKQALNILNGANGSTVWKNDISTKYISYLEDWSTKLLVAHSSGFNFFNYADGKKVWKKDAKGDNIKRVIAIDNDYLYITGQEMSLIDQEGINKWKKTIEISDNDDDPVYFLGKVENDRVFYLTAIYANMVDYASGKKIWKKNIEFQKDKPLLYTQDENTKTFLVYNDKKIYKFDHNTAERPDPIAKLKAIKEDKTISGIDLFDWGICMTGQSDAIGVGFDGNTIYHNTYQEPGGGKRKFMNAAGKVAAVGLGTASSVAQAEVVFYSRDENGELHEAGRSNLFDKKTQKTGQAAGGAADVLSNTVLSRTGNRFNAMKQNSDYAFVLTKGEKGENPLLVKVRKQDGVEIDKISIDNNKPIYEVDPVTDDIYYAYKNELRIFKK